MIIRGLANSRVHRMLFWKMVEDDGIRMKLGMDELVSINAAEDGEWQYAIVPYYRDFKTDEDNAYADAITYEYAGDILDTIIHCPDGDVRLGDLNPQTGIMLVGDYDLPDYSTDTKAGDGRYNNYLYDDEN